MAPGVTQTDRVLLFTTSRPSRAYRPAIAPQSNPVVALHVERTHKKAVSVDKTPHLGILARRGE